VIAGMNENARRFRMRAFDGEVTMIMSNGATRQTLAVLGVAILLAACAPEVGSERWCEAMRDKARGDWSANEALEYARSCIVD
jgi:Protein of unknown function (DUF3012)